MDSNLMFIGPIISGQNCDVQIRSLQSNGAASDWVGMDSFGGLTLVQLKLDESSRL